jgi:hypothetical protein
MEATAEGKGIKVAVNGADLMKATGKAGLAVIVDGVGLVVAADVAGL